MRPDPTDSVSMSKETQIIGFTGIEPAKGQHKRIVHIIDIRKRAKPANLAIKDRKGITSSWICPLIGLGRAIKCALQSQLMSLQYQGQC